MRAVFESLAPDDFTAIRRKPPSHDAIRTRPILHAHKFALIPVQAVNSGKSVVRTRIYILGFGSEQINANNAQHVGDEQQIAIAQAV